MKKGIIFLTLLVLLFTLSGCGGSKSASTADQHAEIAGRGIEYEEQGMNGSPAGKQADKPGLTPKIIKEATLVVNVTDVNETTAKIENMVKSAGGYIQDAHIWQHNGRMQGQMTLKVPVAELEGFIPHLESLGQLESKNVSGKNVTEEYYDTEARKKNLEQQEKRYLELLDKAKNVKDMLEIENELVRVRGEIESLQARLNVLDNLTDMATINIELRAPQGISPVVTLKEPFAERLKDGWTNGINGMISLVEGLVIFIVILIPYAPIIAIVGYVIYRIWRKKNGQDKE